jgi:hypothetical protein
MTADVAIYDQGSIIQFEPLCDEADDWFEKNVRAESWQWLGGRLCVDHRVADDLATGLCEAGFSVNLEG